MVFLDVIAAIFFIYFLCFTRPLEKGKPGFNKDTTAAIRGLAMLVIVLHHIHNNLGFNSPILSQMGYLATGLFFFVSGYGNMLSLNKSNNTKFSWIIQKVVKIYTPFLVGYWVLWLVLNFAYPQQCPSVMDTLIDHITVSLPITTTWFPKIILLCFAIHWIAKKLFNNTIPQNAFILVCILIYIVLMWTTDHYAYWFNSVICYPLGCILAKPKVFDKIICKLKDKKIFSFIASMLLFVVTYILCRKITILQFFAPIFFSLVCYFFSYIFNSKNALFAWIGTNSFEFYIFHTVSYHSLARFISIDKYIYTVLVFVATFILVCIYLLINKKICTHINFLLKKQS